jgi:3D (Asp-Asp-Asp) domain-containing protein
MKRFIFTTGLALLFASTGFAGGEPLLARVTVYWASGGGGSDANTRQHKTATGARLRVGHCAVDPKRIAYGSTVLFPDGLAALAVDTGRDVINRKAARRSGRTATERSAIVVDRFFETKRQAMAWANAHPHFMTVRVLSPKARLAESKKSPLILKRSAQIVVRNTSQAIAKQNTVVPRSRTLAVSPFVNVPRNKLLADNANRAAPQPSRRF